MTIKSPKPEPIVGQQNVYSPGIGQEGSLLRCDQILVGGFKDDVCVRDALVVRPSREKNVVFPERLPAKKKEWPKKEVTPIHGAIGRIELVPCSAPAIESTINNKIESD